MLSCSIWFSAPKVLSSTDENSFDLDSSGKVLHFEVLNEPKEQFKFYLYCFSIVFPMTVDNGSKSVFFVR